MVGRAGNQINFATENGLPYQLLKTSSQTEMMKILSEFKGLIPLDKYHQFPIPLEALKMAEENGAEGIPTGIGYNNKVGFYVEHGGQGPYIAWQEKE